MEVRDERERQQRDIRTEGGTYVEGGVDTGGGDFVGRDRRTEIHDTSGPVAVDGGEAVDLRGAQGVAYKPSGPVYQVQAPRPAPPKYVPPALPPEGVLAEPDERLPPGSRVPFVRNALFTGREALLLALARGLLYGEASSTLVTQAIEGMGGVGKTQLAVEFAYRYGRFFQGVHWINAAPGMDLDAEVATCGAEMALSGWPEAQPEQVTLTLDTWRRDGPRLVILDNLEDVPTARQWLGRLSGARVLLTARRQIWPHTLELRSVPVDAFTEAESRVFLRRYLPDGRATEEEVEALAQRLGHLPLGEHLAGRYLERHPSLGVGAYLGKLEEGLEHRSMQGWKAEEEGPTGHDLDLGATFAVSWEAIEGECARRLMAAVAYCAPNQPIPRVLLAQAVAADGEPDAEACDEALDELLGLGLLREEAAGAGPTIHPLVAEYVQMVSFPPSPDLSPLGGEEKVLAALGEALDGMAGEANKSRLPRQFEPLRAHVEAALGRLDAGEPQALTGWLWNELGVHRHMIANYAGARQAYKRALRIGEAVYGTDSPEVATVVNNLGRVLKDVGEPEQARQAFERALRIGEAVYGTDSPEVATVVNNLGLVLHNLGELEQARQAFERALRIDEAVYGIDHPNVARDVNNLGSVLQDLGELEQARQAYERALRIDEAVYGTDHPSVAGNVNNLGSVLQDLGELEQARQAYERALRISEAVYGTDHPHVATAVNNLGSVLQDLGELEQARQAFERALRIDEAVYGTDHPSVAIRVNNLGRVLQDLGELEQARQAYERALRIRQKYLPADHRDIAGVQRSLAALEEG